MHATKSRAQSQASGSRVRDDAKHVRKSAIPLSATIILVATLGGIYVVSQFLRNSVGVIAPDLARELELSAAEIGVLSSTFFFSFAAAQIPLGVALDRYGPKLCMLVCAGIAAAGARAVRARHQPRPAHRRARAHGLRARAAI